MFFAGLPDHATYHTLLHRMHPGIPRILGKADRGWDFVFLESAPGRRLIEALRRGEVVVCNIDHAYPGTEVTLAPVLGRLAIVPSGVFRIAHRLRSLVVPLAVTGEGGNVLISARSILDWDDDAEPLPVARMLARVQRILDAVVLRAPPEWMGWGNLGYRWEVWKGHARAC
jgi:lauroyl/myristoyl acyltransferase